MKFLTIDVSDKVMVGLCQYDFGEVKELGVMYSADARHHVEALTPMLQEILQADALAKPDAIIVGTGPAPFTGLRAGLVSARALARGWDVPLYGLSSAELLALAACDQGANMVEAIIDARRKEVYALRARAMGADDIEILKSVRIVKPVDLAQEIVVSPALIAAMDEQLYVDELGERMVAKITPALMVRLLISRLARIDAGEDVSLDTKPQYLRRPDIHQGAKAQVPAVGNAYAGS